MPSRTRNQCSPSTTASSRVRDLAREQPRRVSTGATRSCAPASTSVGCAQLRDPRERRPRGDREELPPVAERDRAAARVTRRTVAAESTANGSPSGEPHPKFVAASTSRCDAVGREPGELLRDRPAEGVPEHVEFRSGDSATIAESATARATCARSRMVSGRSGVLEPPVPGASNAIVRRVAELGAERLPRLERRAEAVDAAAVGGLRCRVTDTRMTWSPTRTSARVGVSS